MSALPSSVMGILQKMVWSKSTRIKAMITMDSAFFLLELIAGFLAHSLALTADAFHMLNDIISLVIGLWAVSAAQKATTDEFTFGWVRAEILGAFFNAVFLIALCVTIILEALTRFVGPPDIDNPKLMLIVGFAGLFSNLVGFFVLGGQGHGGHSHRHSDHDHDDAHDHAHSHAHDEEEGRAGIMADESGAVGVVLPEVVVRRATAAGQFSSDGSGTNRRIRFGDHRSRDEANTAVSRSSAHSRGRNHRWSSRSGHSRLASIEDMSIYPASFRQDIIAASMATSGESQSESDASSESQVATEEDEADEESSLLKGTKGGNNGTLDGHKHPSPNSTKRRTQRDSSVHNGHHHTLPKQPGKKGHGHSHGDMGMNAMILHVIGDALGNIGVMVTALIIWLTDWPGKLYADPVVSLLITAIILKTSIPLTLATARVLLQATPEHVSIQEIRQDIERLPGVITCHHIHVWQLSDTKLVASMHIQVSFPIDSHSGEKYMELARRARMCLHGFGIHSATIQPEFCLDQRHLHDEEAAALTLDGAFGGLENDVCLLECVEDCQGQGCCSGLESSSKASSTRHASDSSHSARYTG
ncbi:cation efflux protein [Dactylonectria macrodidyma]|uniref:Cation efflux protein n=1 Tax=Dactylonectria macrodidyma TaxID=307937 RepID=A0A9P9D8N7_9HYPO|nr:cation efflux protein [Dactylonectria macrodidyma]